MDNLKIVETVIRDGTVKITIADNSDLEHAKSKIVVDVPRPEPDRSTAKGKERLSSLQTATLLNVRDAIDEQIEGL